MTPSLQVFIVFALQLEAVFGDSIMLYHRVGDDVLLPTMTDSSSSSCNSVSWFYNKDGQANTEVEVLKGNLKEMSPRIGRLSLSRNCSLVITNIIAEDAGRYTCRLWDDDYFDMLVHLNILEILLLPPDPDADVLRMFQCSLLRYDSLYFCNKKSILWLDETGTELVGEGYEIRETHCVSVLTVKHQRNRKYTCQFVQEGSVKTDAEYILDFTDLPLNNMYWIIGLAVGTVTVLTTIVVSVIICRTRAKRRTTGGCNNKTNIQQMMHYNEDPEDNVTYATVEYNPKTSSRIGDELENHVTYAAVDHSNIFPEIKIHHDVKTDKNVREEEDVVTYSTVRTKIPVEVDGDPISLYNCVAKPT